MKIKVLIYFTYQHENESVKDFIRKLLEVVNIKKIKVRTKVKNIVAGITDKITNEEKLKKFTLSVT